ncbi:hypothetical protein LUU34_01513900 [Aix galericulata]|nr:hypothetical protein LUU34_01513900 [Aix galericulata]
MASLPARRTGSGGRCREAPRACYGRTEAAEPTAPGRPHTEPSPQNPKGSSPWGALKRGGGDPSDPPPPGPAARSMAAE